jgi:OsmC subfamily peroxiredoxin
MRSYHLEGEAGCLVMHEAARPEPGPHQIVVRVRATSLNRRDAMILNGTYPLTPCQGIVPLSDGAGDVVAIGDAVTRFAIGDRVTGSYFARWIDGPIHTGLIDQLGCTLDGMLAEYTLLDEQWAVRLPDHLDWDEAATLTCAGVTAWNAVTGAKTLKPGQWVLVIGTGGVSLYALQFAKMLGCRVVAVTSRAAKAERLRALGADHVIIAFETPEWGAWVRELTGGIDLVVETGGPASFAQSLTASTLYGHVVLLTARQIHRGSVSDLSTQPGDDQPALRRQPHQPRSHAARRFGASPAAGHRQDLPLHRGPRRLRLFPAGRRLRQSGHRRRLTCRPSTNGEHTMTIREASAAWQGTLRQGSGRLRLGSGVFEGAYSFPSRFDNGPGTNPEELIAAAHAGCFSMALSALLGNASHVPVRIHTLAKVHLGTTAAGPAIIRIELETQAEVRGLEPAEFQRLAETAKTTCLVSRALAGVATITLKAGLASPAPEQ